MGFTSLDQKINSEIREEIKQYQEEERNRFEDWK
jgi:hypothetical protein